MTTDTGAHGPTDTPLPAQPSEEHILTTSDESETDTVTLLDPTADPTPQPAPQPTPQPAPQPAPQPMRTQLRG
jgi:dolichol-phosphate mannosyltransferase